jgi:hypothetical protein
VEQPKTSLTGVWQGLYSYMAFREPVYFVATVIQSGTMLTGTVQEAEIGRNGAPLNLFAYKPMTAAAVGIMPCTTMAC